MKIYLLLLALVAAAAAKKGSDMYGRLSEYCINDLKKAGVTYVIPRCFMNVGLPDPKMR